MANPPFNMKDLRAADELTKDSRWDGYTLSAILRTSATPR